MNATDTYGVGKIEITQYLTELWSQYQFPFSILHIGHLVGKGWVPLNPQGNFNKSVFEDIAAGRELLLPDRGSSTLHHVHAADVAQMIMACLSRPDVAAGQVYHTTAKAAMTIRGYAEAIYRKFNQEPWIQYLSLQALVNRLPAEDAIKTFEHVVRSPCVSIEKGQRELGYSPRCTALQAVSEALDYLVETGTIRIGS